MPVSAQAIANVFLGLAKEEGLPLTNMQLQKLVFLGQGYALAILGTQIYYNDTHAWQWGPVVPRLYKDLQKYGSEVVTDQIPVNDSQYEISDAEQNVLRGVWDAYKGYTGSQLSEITHRPGTPWSKTWERAKFGVIPIEEIRDFYSRLISSKN